jgi:xanthosine utilization system XapX-like protein
MKLLFGLMGAVLMIAFLASFIIKVKEPAMIAVALIGVVMMVVDLWHARDEADT